jgi:heat shock protein HslJ
VSDRPEPARARWFALLALAVALMLIAAACGGDDDDSASSSGSKSGESETTPASASDLSGQNWQLKSFVVGSGGTLSVGSEASPATAVFKSGTTTGSTGCNNYTVTYDLGSIGAIKFGAVAATKALCPGNLNEQEQGLINGYGAARTAVINDGALQLLGPGGNPLLIFTPVKGQELEGIDWRLLNFRTPTAVTSSIAGADVTATFADGKLTGSAGCNDYTATYTGGNDTSGALTITGVQLGTKTCTTPEGVAQQEQGYAAALATVVKFETAGNKLTLLNAQGQDAATYQAEG